MKRMIASFMIGLIASTLLIPLEAIACTRVVYKGPNQTVLTGRSMDFSLDIPANIWIFPRGIQRNGEVGPNSITWKSRYGSVVASSWDIATSDGMNEKGLVGNILWLGGSKFPPFDKNGRQKGLTVAAWVQYVLDNFATVAEAVEALRKEEFVVVTDYIPGTDKFTTVHLSLSDATGDNAILEYVNGKLVIHHDPSYTVMTNEPIFEDQLAINRYWQEVPGQAFLPGTNRATDRFVRAKYYLQAIPQTDNPRIAVASVFSLVRNVSVPYGISIEGFPNLSTTQWRVVADQKNLVYYFETTVTPNTFWVDLKRADFSEGAPTKMLDLSNYAVYSGNALSSFKEAKPFTFAGL
ncbi:MAG TPA: linear amide C-N hydrolase [Leptolyngbyaceae cyanobacterium M33_DOE_097]|uniref:Linear amide C-N hydrolase n=1 Tax=Oscillatoriales cyanobacterium SpSt-418 TaxID=2282169 RepID=A0A7C3PJJ7_9CYAN|nr:linear amide C-N hydrolase [Leptolyngbyaceae cyanobacterium M33_DOE_097]